MMKINYLTSNPFKFEIAKRIFTNLDGYEIVQYSFDTPEIQDESCENIARESSLFAARKIDEPCVAMDAGFHINALGGFPGPFIKYINDWLSEEQILSMIKPDDTRAAYFIDALAIGFPDGTSEVFTHKTLGHITETGKYRPSKWL